jgi:hypothetical protein
MMQETYPDMPGFKGEAETSREAAEAIATVSGRLRKLAREAYRDVGRTGLTPEELAHRVGLPRETMQPRTSELKALGILADSGLRRRNGSGKRAAVLVLAEYAPAKGGEGPA